VRTVRTECLDWLLIWNRRHLDQVLTCVEHYNTARPHRGIHLGVPATDSEPVPASPAQIRRIDRVDVLGGLVHAYRHAAPAADRHPRSAARRILPPQGPPSSKWTRTPRALLAGPVGARPRSFITSTSAPQP
jgi:hypothetical protein